MSATTPPDDAVKLAWMPLDIAYYRADTAHLGALQHGIYLLREAYADDYRQARGEEPHANDHGGRWFKTLGEGA